MRRAITAFVIVLSLTTWSLGADKPAMRDTLTAKLFPLANGSKWVYAFGDKDVTFEVTGAEKAGEVTLSVVRRTIDGVAVDFKFAVEEDGVYVHSEGKKTFDPPLRQFAFFARTGDIWKWKGTAAGKAEAQRFEHLGVETIRVPAGTFTAVRVSQSEPDSPNHATFWLAPGTGVIKVSGKREIGEGAEARPVIFEWTLKSYTAK